MTAIEDCFCFHHFVIYPFLMIMSKASSVEFLNLLVPINSTLQPSQSCPDRLRLEGGQTHNAVQTSLRARMASTVKRPGVKPDCWGRQVVRRAEVGCVLVEHVQKLCLALIARLLAENCCIQFLSLSLV